MPLWRWARAAPVAAALLASACAGGPTAEEVAAADRVAVALGRLVRLHYAQGLTGSGQGPAPGAAELTRARDALAEALGRPVGAGSLGSAADAARRTLVRGGYVFLPAGERDPGLPLARAEERRAGLSRTLWDRTVHYRRLTHRGAVIPSFGQFAAARLGRPALAPLGGHAGPTVFLDLAAIERAAGRPPFGALHAEQLATLVEVDQAALLWLDDHDPPRWRLEEDSPARWRAVALLAAVAHAGGAAPRDLLAELARTPVGLGPGTREAAGLLQAILAPGPFAPAAERCYREVRTPEGFVAARARAADAGTKRARR